MGFPVEIVQMGTVDSGFTGDIRGCFAVKRSVHTMSVVILAECFQFLFQVTYIPEERPISA